MSDVLVKPPFGGFRGLKILLINTFDEYGGASLACKRLLKALNQNPDLKAKLLVQKKTSEDQLVEGFAKNYWQKKAAFGRFVWERLFFYHHEKDKSARFAFSPANTGVDISRHPWVREADILHLHWINFGFLSLQSLKKLVQTGKPIVWTLHDMWVFTGGCHYAGDCQKYESVCGNCPFLKKTKAKDLSYRILQEKFKILYGANIRYVTCSNWLAEKARKGSLLKRSIHSNKPVSIQSIPNPIDTKIFNVLDKTELGKKMSFSPDKFYILFGAMNTSDKRKGFEYLLKALKLLRLKYPQIGQDLKILIFGKSSPELLESLPYPYIDLGLISDALTLVQTYNLANLFVLPSLEDNLPNTVMEALACGTPVLAFDTGGIPEMIEHKKNGYLAKYKSVEDLAEGIFWFWKKCKDLPPFESIDEISYPELCENARQKVLNNFSEEIVSRKYIELYHRCFD